MRDHRLPIIIKPEPVPTPAPTQEPTQEPKQLVLKLEDKVCMGESFGS